MPQSTDDKIVSNLVVGVRRLDDVALAVRASQLVTAALNIGMPDSFLRASFAVIADEVARRIGNTAPITNHNIGEEK